MTKRFGWLQMGAIWLTTVFVVGGAVVHADPPPTRRNVEIEWDAVEGATAYDVRVTRKDGGGTPLTFKLNQSRWTANIKAGLYLMQLRAYDDRGVPGAWSPASELIVKLPAVIVTEPKPGAVVRTRDEDEAMVALSWASIPGARRYRVTVAAGDVRQTLESTEPKLNVKLAVAREYAWNVTGIDERGQDGETSTAPYVFLLEGPVLKTPRIERPLSKYVERLSWGDVPKAARYQTELKLYNRATRAWDPAPGPTEVTSPEYPFAITRAAGRYRLDVRAVGDRRPPSAVGRVEFGAAGGFTDETAMRNARLRESLRPAGRNVAFVAIGSGPVDYSSRHAETNSLAHLSGASNGLAFGVARPGARGRWGGAVAGDLGTFQIRGQAFVYATAGARATYRLALSGRDVLTLDAGVFTKQLPVVVGSPTDGFTRVLRHSTFGPAAGFSYVYPFSERWAARGEARAYLNLEGGMSHEAGAYGIYRYGPSLNVTGGLSQRHDEATFKAATGGESFARPGATDQVTMDALRLSIGIELGF